jgi:hypothetical protein
VIFPPKKSSTVRGGHSGALGSRESAAGLHADRHANTLDRKETGGYLLDADPQLGSFGLVGLFLGPVIMAAVLTIWREWLDRDLPPPPPP